MPEAVAHCVVANVAEETSRGEGGLEVRAGLRHFAAGAKVWVLPPQWGDGGNQLYVVGRHRGAPDRYVRMVVSRRHLTRFRVREIYSPAVVRALLRPDGPRTPRLWNDRAEAGEAATAWNSPTLTAEFDDTPMGTRVSDPPPAELEHDGRIYHLAHFNAFRARYSALPPPPEAW